VIRDKEGKPYTVRYDAVNAMLLNEFLKEHRKVEELEATVAQQEKDFQSAIVQQQKKMETLTTQLKEQAAQIQKVSAQIKIGRPGLKTVLNNQ
jgi:septal ring factor EnvC (AmiA/AmiB activator)